MSYKNKLKLLAVSWLTTVSLAAVTSPIVFAGSARDDILTSVNSTDPDGPTVNNAISAAITIFTIIVGVVAVVMMIVGGYKYITSGGDANKVAQAKSTVMYALIGVALVVVSQVLVRFVIAKSVEI
jgi:magnesium-transporting ATPase (P-type)